MRRERVNLNTLPTQNVFSIINSSFLKCSKIYNTRPWNIDMKCGLNFLCLLNVVSVIFIQLFHSLSYILSLFFIFRDSQLMQILLFSQLPVRAIWCLYFSRYFSIEGNSLWWPWFKFTIKTCIRAHLFCILVELSIL